MLDYADIAAQIARKTEADYTLSASTYVLFLSSLSQLRGWRNAGDDLTTAQWDNVDNWIAGAYLDLLTEHECEVGVSKIAVLHHRENKGVNGGSAVVGHQERPLTVVSYDPDDLIDTLTANNFQLNSSGLYRITAFSATWNTGKSFIGLWENETRQVYEAVGEPSNGYHQTLDEVLQLEAATDYYLGLYCNVANAGNGLGNSTDESPIETYATLTIELLAEDD